MRPGGDQAPVAPVKQVGVTVLARVQDGRDGYWVVNPRRPWAGQELRFEAQVHPGAPIVLATDGFMRLVDVFAVYSDGELHDRLAAGQGPDLMQELRERERGDLMAGAFPRVKTHDDATFLVMAAERSR